MQTKTSQNLFPPGERAHLIYQFVHAIKRTRAEGTSVEFLLCSCYLRVLYKTDHSMMLLKIALHHNPRGRCFWKLNTSLLKEEEYLNLIKTTIYQTKNEYQSDNSVNHIGISHVNQIVKEQPSTFLSPTEFESKYHTKVCPLTLYGMTSTLRELWKNKKPLSVPLNCKEQESFTTGFFKIEKAQQTSLPETGGSKL